MKKLLGVLLACALVVPAMAGNIFNNVETYGEVQTIGVMAENATGDNFRNTTNRVLFGLGMDLVEDVRSNLTFGYSNYWDNTEGSTLDYYWNNIYVAEANVVLSNLFANWELKVGRQFYGNEDSAVMYIGPKHYIGKANVVPGSIDAALLTYNSDNLVGNIIYGKLDEVNHTADKDVSFMGLDGTYNVNENLGVQAYLYDERDSDNAGGENYHLGLWGLKPTWQNDVMAFSAEFAKNYANDVFGDNNVGWMAKVDAKMDMTVEAATITPRLTYYHAEKDFMSYGNYNPGLFIPEVVNPYYNYTRSMPNTRVLNLGVDFAFANLEKFAFAVDYLALAGSPSTNDAPALSCDNPHWIGNEFDLTAKYNHNEYVQLFAGAGVLLNHNSFWSYKTNTPYIANLGMLIKF